MMSITTAAAFALVLAACGSSATSDDTTRDDSGEIVEEGQVGALAIQVGDCLGSVGTGEITSTEGVPCETEHEYEVFHAFDLTGTDFPGDDEVANLASEGCLEAFEPFVGIDYESSIYGFNHLVPTQEGWDQVDDREVLCIINNFDGTLKTGSAEGTAE